MDWKFDILKYEQFHQSIPILFVDLVSDDIL